MDSLDADVVFPEDCIEVIRSRPFTFSSRSCNKWALGRVLLCGDAAHVFPPCEYLILFFNLEYLTDYSQVGGQGIASGFRDASSLAWRLAVACRPNFQGYSKLFESGFTERKQQLEKSLAATIVNGNFCNERNTVKILLRNCYLWVLQLIPSWRHWMELGQRQEGLTRYSWAPGMPFLPDYQGGKGFPQVYCVPHDAPAGTKPVFTDDVIFSKDKQALFQLVVLLPSAKALSTATAELADFAEKYDGELRWNEATFIIDGAGKNVDNIAEQKLSMDNVYRIYYAEEHAKKSSQGPPYMMRYDGARMRKDVKSKFVIVRPDRFVFAECNTTQELVKASRALDEILSDA